MRLGVLATLAVTVFAWACAVLLGVHAMPAYLAAWLVFLAVPTGALPIVMVAELAGAGGSRRSGFVRWLLLMMPAAALTSLPLWVSLGIYPWDAHSLPGFGGAWFSPLWFCVRAVAYLVIWNVLAVLNVSPPVDGPRVGRCCVGLALHMVVGTLAAIDWILSLSPGFHAAGFGLLVVSSQIGIALSLALLLVRTPPASALVLLLVTAAVWGLLHTTQYLIVWSANLPAEVEWYLQRGNWLGGAVAWLGVLAIAAPLAMNLLPRWRGGVFVCAALLLAANAMGMFWLVTPSLRHLFRMSLTDLGAMAALVLVLGVLIRAWQPRPVAV